MTAREKYRYERKFVISGVAPEEVGFLVRRHPAMFVEIYPRRWVNNIYFDSPDLLNVQDNVAGSNQRTKTRIRWYGGLLGRIATPVLERKIKRGYVGRKVLHGLAHFDLNEGFCSSELQEALRQSGLPEPIALELRSLQPTLMNRYSRQYYQSATGRYRITIDAEMSFHAIKPLRNHLTQWARAHSVVVLELKYAPDDDDGSAAITQLLPRRICRNSKYVTGMRMVYPTVN